MFTQDQMGRIAQKLGFNGPTDKFGEFLASNPAANRAYTGLHNKVNMKFNRGGVVSMAVGGSAPKQFTDFDLQQYKKAQDAEGLTPAEQVMKQSQDMAKFKAQGYTFDPARMDKFFNVDTTTGIANAAGMTSSLTTNPVTPPTPATPAAKSVTIGGSNDINNVFSGTTSGSVLGFNNTLPPGVICRNSCSCSSSSSCR